MYRKTKTYIVVAAFLAMNVIAPVAHGAQLVSTTNNISNNDTSSTLARLIILDSLFSEQAGTGSLTGTDSSELTRLIILDSLFNGNSGISLTGNRTSATTLGELLVLDSLFNNTNNGDSTTDSETLSRLGKLLIINGLFSQTAVNSTVVTPGSSTNNSANTDTNTSDIQAPVISNVSINGVTSTSGTIRWSTSENATGAVYISTSFPVLINDANKVVATSGMTTSHTVNLTNLTAHTVYFFLVESVDASGNIMRTVAQNFITV